MTPGKLTILLLPVALALLAGCAGRADRTVVVLLPDPEGSVGQLEVSTPAGSRTLDEAGEATSVQSREAVPSPTFIMEDKTLQERFGGALEALPVAPATFILYFIQDSEDLTPESTALLSDIVESVKARDSVSISVVGHTDRAGSDDYNFRLAKLRAEAVSRILASEGVDPSSMEVTSHGEQNPLVSTADEVSEPRNRRVEVTVR